MAPYHHFIRRERWKQLTKRQIALSIVLIVGLWVLSGVFFSSSTPEENERQTERFSVRADRFAAKPIYRYVILYGRTEADRMVEIIAEVEGKVRSINVAEGAVVKAGDPIVTLEERDRSARLEQARARVRQRELDNKAQNTLQKKGYAAGIRAADAKALYEEAKAELAVAELAVERMYITAPFEGIVDRIHVEEGQLIKANGDPVAQIVDNDPIIIYGQVSEFDFPYIKAEQRAEITLTGNIQREGTVRHISKVADPDTHTFRIEITVPNAERTVPSGVTAELRIPVEELRAHLVSMSVLTLGKNGEVGVKTVDDKGLVSFVPVEIIRDTSDGMWVAGLPEEATIITLGGAFVQEGEVVEVRMADEEDKAS